MVRNRWWLALFAGMALGSAGCTMCAQTPEDYTYAAYGGLVQRADMLHGRVGSAFSPAEGVIAPSDPAAIPYDGAVLMAPEEAPAEIQDVAPAPPMAHSQPTTTAFDPGDILASGAR